MNSHYPVDTSLHHVVLAVCLDEESSLNKERKKKKNRKKRWILMEEKNGFLYTSSPLVLFRSLSKSHYGEPEIARIHSAEDS